MQIKLWICNEHLCASSNKPWQSKFKSTNHLLVTFLFFIYLFLERERNINVWCCLPHAPCWGPRLQHRHAPWPGIKLATFCFAGRHSNHWATPANAACHFCKKPGHWNRDFPKPKCPGQPSISKPSPSHELSYSENKQGIFVILPLNHVRQTFIIIRN